MFNKSKYCFESRFFNFISISIFFISISPFSRYFFSKQNAISLDSWININVFLKAHWRLLKSSVSLRNWSKIILYHWHGDKTLPQSTPKHKMYIWCLLYSFSKQKSFLRVNIYIEELLTSSKWSPNLILQRINHKRFWLHCQLRLIVSMLSPAMVQIFLSHIENTNVSHFLSKLYLNRPDVLENTAI